MHKRLSCSTKQSSTHDLLELAVQEALRSRTAFVHVLYQRFLTKNPTYKNLFEHIRLENQHPRLFLALDVIFGNLGNPQMVEEFLADLGRAHFRRYHVPPESFAPFGEALKEMFAEFLGNCWTAAHAQAWKEVYDELVCVMMLAK
jgi:hemoglobin-like flavoprotein